MTDLFTRTRLIARKIMEDTGLSLQEVASLDLSEYSRLSGRLTPAEAARAAIAAQYEQKQPQAPAAPQTAPQPPESQPQGVDIASMDMATYAALRGQLGVTGREYGRGILDGGSTDAWVQAARAKSGRAAMNEHNVQEAPRLTGRTILRQDDMRDTRSMSGRFGTPGNFWQA